MKIKDIKIEIKIKNAWKYRQVAYFVDREEFLNDIIKVRKSLHLIKLIPYSALRQTLKQPFFRGGELEEKYNKFYDGTYERGLHDSLTRLYEGVDIIRLRHKKDPSFNDVIRFSILCGVVSDECISGSTRILSQKDLQNITMYGSSFYIDEYEKIIIVNPNTKVKDFNKALKTIRNALKGQNVKRDREWYWRNQSGEGYIEIAISDNKNINYLEALTGLKKTSNNPIQFKKFDSDFNIIKDYKEKVRKAIERYKKAIAYTPPPPPTYNVISWSNEDNLK